MCLFIGNTEAEVKTCRRIPSPPSHWQCACTPLVSFLIFIPEGAPASLSVKRYTPSHTAGVGIKSLTENGIGIKVVRITREDVR